MRTNFMNEKDLYNKIVEKNEDAFEKFIDVNINLFYKIAMKVMDENCSENDIDDCIADSVIYIWYHIKDYKPDKCSFRNWCSLIVLSRAVNQYKSVLSFNKKLEKFKSEWNFQNFYVPSAEDIFYKEYEQECLFQKIFELPSLSSKIIIRRYIYDQKPKQIAEELNLSVKQVNNYLFKAKKKLKKGCEFD